MPQDVVVLTRIEMHVLGGGIAACPYYWAPVPERVARLEVHSGACAGDVGDHEPRLPDLGDDASVDLLVVRRGVRDSRLEAGIDDRGRDPVAVVTQW
jgi:hypothetical protein